MAYEHGSLDLGIRNPFRFEGTIRAFRGCITTALGILVLLNVTSAVAIHQIAGWITIAAGFILLSNGLWTLGSGLMQTLRFFVGRSVPTSLSYNFATSETDSAKREQNDVAYDADQLKQMLVGRKNLTFTEPQGLIGRLIHTLFPKLTFVPYPIRNIAQRLSDTIVQTAVALAAFAMATFVLNSGLIGSNSTLIQPVLSTLFLFYLVFIWYRTGAPISRSATQSTQSHGAGGIARTLVLAVLFPIGASFGVDSLISSMGRRDISNWLGPIEEVRSSGVQLTRGLVEGIYDNVSNFGWIMAIAALGVFALAVFAVLINKRCCQANPITEVSELRENWQESVHPREIFINLDSMVMANRRYKEVPNRVYRSLKPILKEQSNGKGSFYGETIQETQPKVKANQAEGLAKALRITATVAGQAMMLLAAITLFSHYELIFSLVDAMVINTPEIGRNTNNLAIGVGFGEQIATLTNAIIAIVVLALFGRLMTNLGHVFWSEIQFESQLIYFKCEGTFTESTISTGKGIYDSTQSENVIVRSSMTPWVIVTNAVSSTFAGVGSKNLEQSRHLMELHQGDEDLTAIVGDLRQYLASRQTIANLNTEADVQAASQIHEINQQSRAIPVEQPKQETVGAIGASHNQLEHQE